MPTKKFDNCTFLERSGYTPDPLALELPPRVLADGAAIPQGPSLYHDNRHGHTTPTEPRARIGFDRFSQNHYPTLATARPSLLLWGHIHYARSVTKHKISDSSQRHVLIVGKSDAVQCFCRKSLPNSKAPLSKPAPLAMKQPGSAPGEIRSTGNQSVQNRYQTPETVCPNFLPYRICAVTDGADPMNLSTAPFWASWNARTKSLPNANELVSKRRALS